MKFLLPVIWLGIVASCASSAQGERYRGDYTLGHEVNSFCPEISSECYWLGPNSAQVARERLKTIYRNRQPGRYKPVCVVVDGVIDRDSPRDGFAADYDGLIDIHAVPGACNGGTVIVPGDLNHRRWVLTERNGTSVDASLDPVVLDFGERLFVEGRDGCQRFSGFVVLNDNQLSLDGVDFDRSSCAAGELAACLFVNRLEWQLTFSDEGLVLQDVRTRLDFRRDDWR